MNFKKNYFNKCPQKKAELNRARVMRQGLPRRKTIMKKIKKVQFPAIKQLKTQTIWYQNKMKENN